MCTPPHLASDQITQCTSPPRGPQASAEDGSCLIAALQSFPPRVRSNHAPQQPWAHPPTNCTVSASCYSIQHWPSDEYLLSDPVTGSPRDQPRSPFPAQPPFYGIISRQFPNLPSGLPQTRDSPLRQMRTRSEEQGPCPRVPLRANLISSTIRRLCRRTTVRHPAVK